MTPQEIARKVLELYDGKPERWTQGAQARSVDGYVVNYGAEAATCWCLMGAINRTLLRDVTWLSAFEAINRRVTANTGTEDWAEQWNDLPGTTFADVVALLERIAAEPEASL